MKYLITIFVFFLIFNHKGYTQETKISLSKNDFASDTQCVYTFNITPFKGDSIYSFKVYLVDTLSDKTEIISSTTISVMLRRIEKEVFYKDKFGNKRGKFNFEYYVKNNEEYSDDYLKIPVSINKRTLEGNIILKPGKKYIFVFDNSKEVMEKFDLPSCHSGGVPFGSSRNPVIIKVYDVMGHEFQTRVNESLKPGTYETIFNDSRHGGSSTIKSGVYFYKLITDGFTETKKMLMIK